TFPRDLQVLLRHRLLPQPHGFEGVTVVTVVLEMGEQPVSVARQDRHRTLSLDPAPSSGDAERSQPQHSVSEIANVRVVNLEHLVFLREISKEPPQTIVP